MLEEIQKTDSEVFHAIQKELGRQRDKIELIASENFTSLAVMQAQGTWLTNKYAEGLPAKRYYGGCEYVDIVEQLAIERVCRLFGAEHANVQPHSGAQANTAVYFSFLKPGDKVLGMNLSHGGHLTHGSHVNFSGAYFHFSAYGVDPATEQINYDEVEQIALEEKPKMIVAGASAYPRKIDFERFSHIAKKVGAVLFVDMAHIAGLVAVGLHQNPVHFADIVTSTTHKTLRGPRGGVILCKKTDAQKIDKAVFPGIQGGPLMHVIAAKAVSFLEALQPSFKLYQEQVLKNAKALAETLISHGFKLVSGGTDNHLMLVNLGPKNITGKDAEKALDQVGITVNKNTIPFETQSPFVTSGIRIGTPAMTTRGLKEEQMRLVGRMIAEVLSNMGNETVAQKVQKEVQVLCQEFPLYPGVHL